MKSKCCNKPLRLSRENPEPGETMYYICDGCNQPADPKCDHSDENELTDEQLHADDYVDKNYPDEKEVSKLKEASMQNEPQLSAEMEKQIEKILVDMEKHYCRLNGQDDGYLVKKATMRKLLATALEEEREKVLSEVEEGLSMLTRYLRSIYRLDHSDGEPPQQMLLEDDVMSVLNQLKGTEWVGIFAPNGGHDPNNPYPLKRKE